MLEAIIQTSQCILLPSGRDYAHCVDVFESMFHIRVPVFPTRVLCVDEGGRRFVKVKSRDVPKLIHEGFGDVGIAYTDVCEETSMPQSKVKYKKIGDAELRLSLLIPRERKKDFNARLSSQHQEALTVATPYPNLLNNYLQTEEGRRLNVVVSPFIPTGSAEAMISLGVADVVADVVRTGGTARANNLEAIPLTDISPAIVYRK